MGHACTHHHTATQNNQQKTTTTHSHYSATGPWQIPRQALVDLLQKLINRRKIDIAGTGVMDYIDRIHHKYFRPRNILNFRRNDQSYTRSSDL